MVDFLLPRHPMDVLKSIKIDEKQGSVPNFNNKS
jgi:hypothetical protein